MHECFTRTACCRFYSRLKSNASSLHREHSQSRTVKRIAVRRHDRSTHGASKSNIKNDTSVRGRMGENLYFSSVSGACLARFFGRRLSAVKSPFAVLLPIVHSAFAFLSCRLMPLQPFLPGYSLLHPAFNARFFSVHLFRRARSLDCLGRCAKGLDDSGPPFFFLFLPLSSLPVAPYLFVRIPLSISEYIPHRHIVSLDI